jgi:2-methylcitrate dehydratase PrpD
VSATTELSEFISALEPDQVPDGVLHQARRCLIDWLGVTLAGSRHASVVHLCAAAEELDSGDEATLIGRGRGASLPWAALINGFMSHVLDYDDTFNPARTTVHGSAPVWPVVLALAERLPFDGARALAAFIAGFETEVRVALAAGPAHYEAGWHVTGTAGHFGAAAAGANALRLPPLAVANALGVAGTQAAGLKGVYGSMGKALHPGKAAMDGLLAAFLAREGFTATDSIIEGVRGFLQVLSPDSEPLWATRGLGREWMVCDDGFKPYPCGSLTHPTIEGVIDLRRQHEIDPAEIDYIESTVNDYVSWVTGNRDPTTGLEAKFSIYHCAAVAALDGRAGLTQFESDRVLDPDVMGMRARVRIDVDKSLPKDAARVSLLLSDGRRLTREVLHNKGTPAKPMSDSELEEKFLELAGPLLGSETAKQVVRRCWRFEEVADAGEIVRMCRGQQ